MNASEVAVADIQLEPYCFEESLGFLLSRLKARMSAELDEELAGLDITHAQWVVLVRIANGMGHTCAALSRGFGQDTGAMTRMLDRLEEKQLVIRERSAEDRRVIALRLTPQGEALYPQLLAAGRRLAARAIEGFEPAEVDLLRSLLRRMLGNLGLPEVNP